MQTERLLDLLDRHRGAMQTAMSLLLASLIAGVYILVYMTGGIKFVYSHSMYIPILLSAFVFGIKGGVLIGLIGGIALGPFMPIDVVTGEMQEMANWLYRTGFFLLIGFLSGVASDSVRSYIKNLAWLSQHDISTRLPNRNALFDRLSELGSEKNTSDSWLLVVISFENMMELKSAFGFTVIEDAIRQLADRFDSIHYDNIHVDKLIFHTATAQISVLIDKGDRETRAILGELVEAAREPIRFNGIPIHIDIRMGTVAFSSAANTPEIHLQKAEAALAVAQATVQDSVAYSPEILNVTEENLTILGELKDAIKEQQISMHYQPKIFIPTGQVHGVEALMRWKHPKRGNIPPGIFIPRAEQSTMIQLITEFALDQAMAQIVRWRQLGIHVPVAVNISTRNLLQPGFTDQVLKFLDHYGLEGESLELEVTEGALMMDMKRTIAELVRLAQLKVIISIDDFGTGYSSLQYLHELPISLIKIDQTFVRRLPADKGAVYILEAAVMLAHKMGIKAIAEGVETEVAYEFLSNIGCDIAQGYLISPPLPADEFTRWYTQRNDQYVLPLKKPKHGLS